MTSAASPRLPAYAALAAVALVAALALRRPELAVLAAPFALLVALGLMARPPAVGTRVVMERERALEEDEVALDVVVHAAAPVDRLELLLDLPAGLDVVEGTNPVAIHLEAGEERRLSYRLRCMRWGTYPAGRVLLRARDRVGMLLWEREAPPQHELRVYPRPEQLRDLFPPARTQAASGNEVARTRGDGIEFADTRAFVPGDRLRAVNWRASARRDTLVVNVRHPERSADVVLFLDSFAEAREADEGTLERAVRVAATLADLFLRRRDRVGLVSFGGIVRWLEPASGAVQRYRLIDALLETEVQFSYAWKGVDVIPARTLPPHALVVAVTPLLDRRSVAALLDLRARGHDLAVIEVAPDPFVEPGADEPDVLAHRLWLLRRDELRSRLERLGAAVGRVDDETPLDATIEGVRAFRRHARLARR